VRAKRIGPVRFERNRREAVLGDETPGQLRAQRVELLRTVRRLADQDGTRTANALHDRRFVQRACVRGDAGGGGVHG
jgi:hypothetical protein